MQNWHSQDPGASRRASPRKVSATGPNESLRNLYGDPNRETYVEKHQILDQVELPKRENEKKRKTCLLKSAQSSCWFSYQKSIGNRPDQTEIDRKPTGNRPVIDPNPKKCRRHKNVRTEILCRMVRSRGPQLSRKLLSLPFLCLCLESQELASIPKSVVITKTFAPKFCAEWPGW